jgi:uncharacterized protein YdcH (DUF465 family)|tara:strand:- start:141 stop:317 length:177 start_codon:yes stop_codon:yes gene_type:complete
MVKSAKTVEYLEQKHKKLHDKLEAAEAEKAPEQYLKNMKKEKLALKDEIVSLKLANFQ